MITPDLYDHLPSSEELPSSDDTPVDNEDQNFLPNFLLFLLESLWSERMDWFFGVDMAIYHTTGISPRVPIVPDGFLSVGVQRRKGGKSRKSYVVWEEDGIVPLLVLEIVSGTPGGEYEEKAAIYAHLGVLYYLIYNPDHWQRDRHQPFELYRLEQGRYQLQPGEPYWMAEIGLGIGRFVHSLGEVQREMLYWYDAEGSRYLGWDEQLQFAQQYAEQERQRAEQERQRAEQERQRAEQERQRAEQLVERLRQLGVNPDEV